MGGQPGGAQLGPKAFVQGKLAAGILDSPYLQRCVVGSPCNKIGAAGGEHFCRMMGKESALHASILKDRLCPEKASVGTFLTKQPQKYKSCFKTT